MLRATYGTLIKHAGDVPNTSSDCTVFRMRGQCVLCVCEEHVGKYAHHTFGMYVH